MKRVFPTKKHLDWVGDIFLKTHEEGSEMEMFYSLWPVYAPYHIYEIQVSELVHNHDDITEIDEKSGFRLRHCKEWITYRTGEWMIQGQSSAYRKVWESEGTQPEGVRFISPTKEFGLLKDFLSIDIYCNESILGFVNRYGLLGISFKNSPSWITAQMPAVSFGVEDENLEDFQAAVQTLQETYNLWKPGKDTATVLRKLRHHLAGVSEYPQIGSNGNIIPGERGQTLLDYIWLWFYKLVLGKDWRECAYCGNLFEKTHGHAKYCPECNMPGQTPPWIKLKRQQEGKKTEKRKP
jgi:hypothetical protein